MSQESKKESKRDRPIRGPEPNAETRAAIEELESGKGKRAATVEELMAELNAEEEGA
jgi:antitoxin component of RelBE/YafQ-DinJ toxin-antitoxin module